jgi:hypothetical protein
MNVNNQLEIMWKEAVTEQFKILFQRLSAGTRGNYGKLQPIKVTVPAGIETRPFLNKNHIACFLM